jgi:Domain of unknown function (DUF4174)
MLSTLVDVQAASAFGDQTMKLRHFGIAVLLGASAMMHASHALQLDEWKWKSRVLVVVGPAEDSDVRQQREIYQSAVNGMSERQIVLAEALDDSERSHAIRSRVAADGRRFHAFLIGKDGHVALSSDKPLAAAYLFQRIDAMPMRQDEMRRAR